MEASPNVTLGADTGGTFTDLVLITSHGLALNKVPSLPTAPQTAILNGIQSMLGSAEWPRATKLVHGTTVATNALLQREGAKVLFVTNQGFEDIPEIGRQNRELLYSLQPSRPLPLVPQHLRLGLVPRRPLTDSDMPSILDPILELVAREAIEAIAICLLDAFEDPANERILGAALAKKLPLPISLSHQVHPRHREFERSSTTLVNAFVQPVMRAYCQRLQEATAAQQGRLEIMGSHGGTLTPQEVFETPYLTLLSGPAAGVAAALRFGKGLGLDNLVTFDMGGTSTDVCLIRNGRPAFRNQADISGLPILGRMLDIHTVGAGGGSIARFDAGGAMQVGPQSAGAQPGPAAYGRGGPFTVSDAHFLTGTLPPHNLLGGAFPVDPSLSAAAAEALKNSQPAASRLSALELAEGTLMLANQTMIGAIRKISVERGFSPRAFTLCAFGGAGGLHACELAEALEMPRVWFPPHPGLFSALGMALCKRSRVWTHSLLEESRDGRFPKLEAQHAHFWEQARAEAIEAGIPAADVHMEGILGIRYRGQAYELEIPYSPRFIQEFHQTHQRRFGWSAPEQPIQLIYLHVIASGPDSTGEPSTTPIEPPAPAPGPSRTNVFRHGRFLPTPCFDRDQLTADTPLHGPLIVREYSSTIWIPPAWTLIKTEANHLFAVEDSLSL